jgi:hypothetical protein
LLVSGPHKLVNFENPIAVSYYVREFGPYTRHYIIGRSRLQAEILFGIKQINHIADIFLVLIEDYISLAPTYRLDI